MNFFLIDFENINSEKIKDISGTQENDVVIIFYSEHCLTIQLDVVDYLIKAKMQIRTFNVKVGTHNALDFQLSSYLGYLIGKAGDGAKYHIVSNDKGYDNLCEYWQEQEMMVDRISFPVPEIVAKEKTQKSSKRKVNTGKSATLEEIKQYLSDEDMPNEILAIFNKFKTKQAICNGIAKKCKDSKRASMIYKKLKPLLKEKKKG